MITRVHTVAFSGIDVRPIEVQVLLASGMPIFNIVGLADKAVAEARERIRAALGALGLSLPTKRVTINLAPADVQKEGTHYDLPMALGLLGAMGILTESELGDFLVLGELALDGAVRAVPGVLPAAVEALAQGLGIICPASCGSEALWAGQVNIVATPTLLALMHHLKGNQQLPLPKPMLETPRSPLPDLCDVSGQPLAKRALEIAAAGGHNLLLVGPPGSGKSMLSARLPSILPDLTPAEALDLSMMRSISGLLKETGLPQRRPFRAPHHSASLPALVGGGTRALPGEISLAHGGVLFLDEWPEFSRAALEALRQPLEAGTITVARANHHITYPARIQLIAAMNPCKCGYFGDPTRQCSTAPGCAARYQSKLSGPLLDRIDLAVDVPPLSVAELTHPQGGETSEIVRARVLAARQKQSMRAEAYNLGTSLNAQGDGEIWRRSIALNPGARTAASHIAAHLRLSGRGYIRLLRVARTIADLDGMEGVSEDHILEAASLRIQTPGKTAPSASPPTVPSPRLTANLPKDLSIPLQQE